MFPYCSETKNRKKNGRFVKMKAAKKNEKFILGMAEKWKQEERLSERKSAAVLEEETKVVCHGRRIVDLMELGKNLTCHKCKEVLSLRNIESEQRVGFHSRLQVMCLKCNVSTTVKTGKLENNISHTNMAVIHVKYLREVTPYFRKASIIQEVGWELQRGFLSATPPPPKSPPRADTRYLPLQLCRLTRSHPSADPESRILELHSPDGVHECWLRASDNTEANVWFNALHSALAALTLKALRLASALPDPPQLQHIGWLARRHCVQNGRASSESSEDGVGSSASTSRGAGSGFGTGCTGGWRSVFGAVSGRELRLYECAPWSPEAWASPSITCPLIATRLVSSPTRQNEASSSNSTSHHGATFAVRVGTIDGVITHNLRAETRRDLAAWARAIVQGCHSAALSLREYTVRCVWQGRACQLVVNHEDGFTLYAAGARGVAGSGVSPGSPPTPLWRRSFDKLKMSADDGARLLWLDFGGEDGEIELDLESCPKPIVFVLHNFLSAKIHRLGLTA